MKVKKVFLNELTTSSKNYKVQVKVIEKGRPQISQLRKLPYQGLTLLDEKGNKMRGALFGDQVRNFKDAIVYNGTYEIANAPISHMEDKWKKTGDELSYQMSFGRDTIIQPVNTEAGPVEPDYKAIGQIPKAGDPADKFDVLGIVLFADEKPREANIGPKRKIGVTEVVLMDHSTQQPLAVSVWDDLADTASKTLLSKSKGFAVVAFTALKVSSHKGFSMTTTVSSDIIQAPTGEKATALENWAASNLQKLTEVRTRIVQAKVGTKQKNFITVAELHAKRAHQTFQDERYWLHVTVPSAEFDNLNAYLGCSKCGRRSQMPAEANYSCPLCNKEGCISTPRATFSCEVTDGTGSLPITAFTNSAEQLFRIPCQDIFRIKHSEDEGAFEVARNIMRKTTYLIEVGPKNTLSISNILEWVLKQVVVEEEKAGNTPAVAGDSGQGDKEGLEKITPDLGGAAHLKTPNKEEVRKKRKATTESTLVSNATAETRGINTVLLEASNDITSENEDKAGAATKKMQGNSEAASGHTGDIAP